MLSAGNNNNNNNNKKRVQKKAGAPPLYQPSIYSFTCRGAYHVSTNIQQPLPPNSKTSILRQQQGTCRGLQSQLELLTDDFEVMPRDYALKGFGSWVSENTDLDFDESTAGGGGDLYGADNNVGGENAATNETTAAISVPNMLIHKEDNVNTSSAPIRSKPNKPKRPKATNENETKLPPPAVPVNTQTKLPSPQDLIQREDWSCYGSTVVDYLVLKNVETGEERIAAVAPHDTLGMSIRSLDIEPDTRTSLIQFGWVTVVMHSTDSTLSSSADNQNKNNNNANNNNNDPTLPAQDLPPPIPMDYLQTAQASVKRTVEFSGKVAQHMQTNLSWLYHNLQDDFLRRTYQSGHRIVDHIPQTVERTSSVMKRMGKHLARDWFGWEDDGDNDRGDRRR